MHKKNSAEPAKLMGIEEKSFKRLLAGEAEPLTRSEFVSALTALIAANASNSD